MDSAFVELDCNFKICVCIVLLCKVSNSMLSNDYNTLTILKFCTIKPVMKIC